MNELIILRPSPLYASKRAVSDFAEKVGQEIGYSPRESMHDLVSRLNGRISYDEDVLPDDEFPEAITVQPSGEFEISLPTVTSVERDRFTIAHELGHFFLHFPAIRAANPNAIMAATRKVNHLDESQKRAEWEANWFAASFLMPRQEFTRIYNEKGLNSAASFFGVSRRAAEVRAENLSL